MLQGIVDEVLAHDVWITRTRRPRQKELVEARPSIRLAVAAAQLSRKVCEHAAAVKKAGVTIVLAKRK